MESKSIKKHLAGAAGYLVLDGLFLRAISHINVNDFQIIDGINIAGLVVVSILTIDAIFWPYMVIHDGTINIRRSPFHHDKFDITDVAEITISNTPFSRSHFQLKNQRRINFDSFSITNKNLAYLESLCTNTESIHQ